MREVFLKNGVYGAFCQLSSTAGEYPELMSRLMPRGFRNAGDQTVWLRGSRGNLTVVFKWSMGYMTFRPAKRVRSIKLLGLDGFFHRQPAEPTNRTMQISVQDPLPYPLSSIFFPLLTAQIKTLKDYPYVYPMYTCQLAPLSNSRRRSGQCG
jgi:hypothetical protein